MSLVMIKKIFKMITCKHHFVLNCHEGLGLYQKCTECGLVKR